MPSEELRSKTFQCHLCDGHTFRVVVRGNIRRHQAAGHGEASLEEYACTSRHHGQFFQVVECTRCHLRSLFPPPPAHAVERAYTRVKDEEYLFIEEPRKVAFTRLLKRLEKYKRPPATLLDVGCYTGIFPMLAQDAGWETYGVEPSAWAAGIAASRLPGKIHQGYLDSAPFPAGSFDVVTSWDVIEHVTHPRKEIERMVRMLRPGGWLILSTMQSEALIVKVLGSRWLWYMPMHLYYFTPRTLGALLAEAGLTPQPAEPYPHYTTVRYVLWKLEPMFGPFARILAHGAQRIGRSESIVKVDLKDFFLMAARKL